MLVILGGVMAQVKILQIIDGLNPGGSQAMIMNIYRKINKEKFHFDFLISRQDEIFFKEEIEKIGGNIYYIPKISSKNFLSYASYWENFYRKHKYQIVHSHVRSTASIDLSIAKKYGAKTIVHSHNTSNGKGLKSLIKYFLQLPLYRIADFCLGCSLEAGIWLYGKRATQSEKYRIIANGIDCNRYIFNVRAREKVRNQLGLDDNYVIGHVGRLSYQKNHNYLLDIVYELCKTDKNVRLLLVGDGELRQELMEKADRLGLCNNVMFIGNVENVYDYLCAMDLYVFPSHYEGLPVTLVEAQCSGLHCLVSDRITKEVFLTPYIESLSINPDNVDVWVTKIEKLINKPLISNRLSGYEKIKSTCFNINNSVKELEDIYENLLA